MKIITHINTDGTRHIGNPETGAWLIFHPDGLVEVRWNRVAAVATAFKGNRDHRPACRIDGVPQLTQAAAAASMLRELAKIAPAAYEPIITAQDFIEGQPPTAPLPEIPQDAERFFRNHGHQVLNIIRALVAGPDVAHALLQADKVDEAAQNEDFTIRIIRDLCNKIKRAPAWDELRTAAKKAFINRDLQWRKKKVGPMPATYQETNFKAQIIKLGFEWLLAID